MAKRVPLSINSSSEEDLASSSGSGSKQGMEGLQSSKLFRPKNWVMRAEVSDTSDDLGKV